MRNRTLKTAHDIANIEFDEVGRMLNQWSVKTNKVQSLTRSKEQKTRIHNKQRKAHIDIMAKRKKR